MFRLYLYTYIYIHDCNVQMCLDIYIYVHTYISVTMFTRKDNIDPKRKHQWWFHGFLIANMLHNTMFV
jgi:hypothetical protein